MSSANPHQDRRIQKTRALLADALGALVREKSYDSITVQEILDRANVGRSTFYTHFRDKDELLVQAIHDMLGPVKTPVLPPSAKRSERIVWFSLPIFTYVDQHRRAGASRMGRRGRAVIHEHLEKVLADLIADEVADRFHGHRRSADGISPDLLACHVASTFVLVLNWWVESGSSLAAKDADAVFRALILPTLESVCA